MTRSQAGILAALVFSRNRHSGQSDRAAFAAGPDPKAIPASASQTNAADPWIAEKLPELVSLYTHLHTHPEFSRHEVETARRIADELTKAGAQVTPNVGELGVVGVLKNGDGPVVLVRTDMDALPVVEETGLPYASKVKTRDPAGREVGVMHACGHDIHMSSFIGTARWLADHRDRWSGTVVMVAQPAEETVGGAKLMLADGLYSRFPKPDFALALHCRPDQPVGTVRYCPGPALASSTSVGIIVRGKGGHGAWPHRTIDPIVLSALLIVDMQTIVSREIEPGEPAVITVGSIHGGTKHNIIPDEVKLQLTLRSFSEPVRQQLIAAHQAQGHRPGTIASSPRADRSRSRKAPRPRSTPPAWSSGSSRPSSRCWAPKTSVPPSRSWAPKTSRSSAKAMFRSACSGWEPSAPSGSPASPPRAKLPPRCTRRSITRSRGRASRPGYAR